MGNNEMLFGELDFEESRPLGERTVSEGKLRWRLKKDGYKFAGKIARDVDLIKGLMDELYDGQCMEIISDNIDSPHIIDAYLGEVAECYVGTWAITPAGIAALKNLVDNGCSEIIVVMDRTHSYKWMFRDGAYKMLEGHVQFKFIKNHSKYIVMRLKDGTCMNFVGSMNLSNNPRFENMRMSKDLDEFEFYKNFSKVAEGLLL